MVITGSKERGQNKLHVLTHNKKGEFYSALASRYIPEQEKITLAAHAATGGASTCPYPRDTQKL